MFLKDETVWLTQKAIAELFRVKIPAISKHLSNIFESGELQKEATLSILETVQKEGNRQMAFDFYIFISQIVEIFTDLCYSITEVGKTGRFRLIMVTPTIDELAALKESNFNGQTPGGGSLSFRNK